ncbi:MAG: LacI family DNA-binding transcriptional regulator [Lachnospiraceae bacterium]|nr:LacI family DNA-binding transcriptional regulator [Lachnospiraceae bacterium]
MGITTKDLAQICGVSRTTVHRALHGTGRINPDTKEMILRVAKENGYRPDLLARGLVKGQTFYIGVVVLDVKNRYFAQMLSTIGAEANKRGYFVNITLHGDDKETEENQLTRLADYHVDGIIVSSVNEGDQYKEFLESLDIPIVSVDNKIAEGIPFVGIDQKQAMMDAAGKVIDRNYEKIVFVCPPINNAGERNVYVHRERLKGFQELMARYGSIETGYLTDWNYLEHLDEMIDPVKKTAFVCTADEFALNIMKRLKKSGLRAGTHYGMIGFDNIDILDYVTPRLTTISNSVEEIAVTAVNLLFDLIEKKKEGIVPEPEEIVKILPYQFIEGETV